MPVLPPVPASPGCRAPRGSGARTARSRSKEHEPAVSTRWRTCASAAAACAPASAGRGLWPEACAVNSAYWQESQLRRARHGLSARLVRDVEAVAGGAEVRAGSAAQARLRDPRPRGGLEGGVQGLFHARKVYSLLHCQGFLRAKGGGAPFCFRCGGKQRAQALQKRTPLSVAACRSQPPSAALMRISAPSCP